MKAFETSTTVQQPGDIRLAGLPFAPGTEVEVTVSQKRKSATEFGEAWRKVTEELRQQSQLQDISDDEIQKEIDDYRAGR